MRSPGGQPQAKAPRTRPPLIHAALGDSELPSKLGLPKNSGQLAGCAAGRRSSSGPSLSPAACPAPSEVQPRAPPLRYLPPSPLPLPALSFPRDSQLLRCLPQGATKPGQPDSAAPDPLPGAAGLARRRARATAHVRNAGSRVSRYTSLRPPSTARLRHNTGRGKFPKPRENALPPQHPRAAGRAPQISLSGARQVFVSCGSRRACPGAESRVGPAREAGRWARGWERRAEAALAHSRTLRAGRLPVALRSLVLS